MKSQQETLLSKHLSTLLDMTSDAIIVRTLQGEIFFWNTAASALYGFSAQEASGQKRELLRAQYAPPWDEIANLLQRQGKWQGEVTCTTSDGQTRVVASRQMLITEDDGSQYILESASDLTERRVLENLLQAEHENAEQWRGLLNFVPSNIWTATANGYMTYVSDTWCTYTGLKPADALGWGYLQTVHPDDQQRAKQSWGEATKCGTSYELVFRWRRFDGAYRWSILQAQPVKGKDDKVISWVGAILDIHAQKLAEETLRESEERFLAFANILPMFIWISDREGNVTYANKYSLDYMCLASPSEFTGKVWETRTDPRDLQRIYDVHRHSIQTHQPYTLEARFLDRQAQNNHYEYFLIQAVPRYLASGEFIGVVGTAVNINDLKKTQQELAIQTTFLRSIIESTPDLMLMKDREGKFLLANHATAKMLAKPIEEIINHYDRDMFPPEVARILMEADRRVMDTENSEVIEEMLPGSSGEKIYLTSKSPLRNTNNEVIGIVVVARDITERKDLEHQKDDFMGVVSHELKTPVTSLKVFAQVLHRRFVKAGDDCSAEVLLKMDVQIDKLTTLIADLLDVTRLEAGKFQYTEKYFSFEKLVQEIIEETQRVSTHHQILLETSDEQMIYGDRERLGQVLINLLTNAIKYSLNAEKILVRIHSDGKNVTVCVQDFGVGIPEDKKIHLFERFYRVSGHTLDTIPGLGLGLYISAEIIKRHEGRIWIESDPAQKGSTFCFTLPIKRADAAHSARAVAPSTPTLDSDS